MLTTLWPFFYLLCKYAIAIHGPFKVCRVDGPDRGRGGGRRYISPNSQHSTLSRLPSMTGFDRQAKSVKKRIFEFATKPRNFVIKPLHGSSHAIISTNSKPCLQIQSAQNVAQMHNMCSQWANKLDAQSVLNKSPKIAKMHNLCSRTTQRLAHTRTSTVNVPVCSFSIKKALSSPGRNCFSFCPQC